MNRDWLVTNLNFSQRSNAGSTETTLLATGFLKPDLELSDRGKGLLDADGSESYKRTCKEGLEAWLGPDVLDTLRSGSVVRENLNGYLARTFEASGSVVKKALPGIAWLAREADDDLKNLLESDGSKRGGTGNAQRATNSTNNRTPRATLRPREAIPQTSVSSTETEISKHPVTQGSSVLSSGVLSIHIDGTWPISKIHSTLRLLQMIEMGMKIPEDDHIHALELQDS